LGIPPAEPPDQGRRGDWPPPRRDELSRRRFLRASGAGLGLAALGGAAYGADRLLTGPAGPVPASHRGLRHRPHAPAVRTVLLDSGVEVPSADWLVAENRRRGTLGWVMSSTTQIYGYADHVSAVPGDEVTLFVDPPPLPYTVTLYRIGYYGGLGARAVWRSKPIAGSGSQPAPSTDPTTLMVECQWQPSLRVGIAEDWPPGAYLFKLTAGAAESYGGYIPLCIRDDASTAAYAIMHSVTTWQAYNAWGSRSLYVGPGAVTGNAEAGSTDRSRVVSFDRPYDQRGWGAPDFMGNEHPLIFRAEQLGLDATYFTDLDLHRDPTRLLRHRCLFSLGHDEYWSSAMRDGATAALAQGTNLAFLGANAVYRHIRVDASPLGPGRHQVCYKTDLAHEDPLWGVQPDEVTANWPDPPVPRPEQQLVGSQYADVAARADLVVGDASAWVFDGTGVGDGQHLSLVVEGEYDHYSPGLPGTPAEVTILAHSPVANRGAGSYSDMTYYSVPGGGGVFASGSAAFVAKLANAPLVPPNIVLPPVPGVTDVLTRLMDNVFSVFGAGPASATHPSSANWQQFL